MSGGDHASAGTPSLASVDLAGHPSPTLARAAWRLLDGPWNFAAGGPHDDPPALDYPDTIEVPFPPESAASGVAVDPCEHPRYRRTFTASPRPDRRLLLHCEGVDHEARIWVNGHFVGSHEGGYAPFVLDLTPALVEGANTLVVAAHDDADGREQPRGKQCWTPRPDVIWYRRSSGIWRSVWLEDVPVRRVHEVAWTPMAPGLISGDVRCTDADGLVAECAFTCEGEPLATIRREVRQDRASFLARLAPPDDAGDLTWSCERPTLVDVTVRLLDGDDVVDEARSYTGLRTVAASQGTVLLNEEPVFLRLVLEQAYWADTHFTAPSLSALRAEAQLIRDLGFNGLRMHQVSADPRFLRACDELGLLVLADLPAAHRWSTVAFSRGVAQALELVRRDRNHPSVIGWVPFNESWGLDGLAHDPAVQAAVVSLHALVKALDPGRLVLGNDGWEHVVGDVIGVHDYSHDPAVLRRRYSSPEAVELTLAGPGPSHRTLLLGTPDEALVAARGRQPVVLSEFGGVSLDTSRSAWSGYGRVRDAEGLLRLLHDLVRAVDSSPGLAGFCWTQLTDTLQEQNGLTDADRVPKAPAARIAAIVTGSGVRRRRGRRQLRSR